MAVTEERYDESSITVLEGLKAVQQNPAMYIGGVGSAGLHHLVYEAIDNAVDEALEGYCDSVLVRLNADGSCTVVDNGRGIPVGPLKHENPKLNGRPALDIPHHINDTWRPSRRASLEGNGQLIAGDNLLQTGLEVIAELCSPRHPPSVW